MNNLEIPIYIAMGLFLYQTIIALINLIDMFFEHYVNKRPWEEIEDLF